MPARQPRFEVVRSDAGWFARIRGANGRKVWQSEIYTRREAALNAFRVLGDLFGAGPARVTVEWLHVPTFEDDGGTTGASGWLALPIRECDEREARP